MRDYVKQCETLPPGGGEGLRAGQRADDQDAEPVDGDDDQVATARPHRQQFQKADAITLKDY